MSETVWRASQYRKGREHERGNAGSRHHYGIGIGHAGHGAVHGAAGRHGRALRGEGGERHRKPAVVHEWAETAHDRGIKVIIAAAGKAAHLGGVVAAFTPLPVIAVPMKTSDLGGLDSLLSMVQMPSGVPVACVAINGAKNAAILAVQMMGTNDEAMLQKVADLKAEMAS